VIELVGHSGTHAPQAIHSSVIFIAIGYHSLVKVYERIVLKITLSAVQCQMTNVFGLNDFVTESYGPLQNISDTADKLQKILKDTECILLQTALLPPYFGISYKQHLPYMVDQNINTPYMVVAFKKRLACLPSP
jgi:hypothetical protein